MLLTLYRGPSSDKGTFGMLCMGDFPLCVTAEDPWNDNKPNISCIPEGSYNFVRRFSPRHRHHWHILNVPNRELVLIHGGNTINDTEGCILIGRSFSHLGNLPSVMQSQDTMQILREEIPDEGVIEIINPR